MKVGDILEIAGRVVGRIEEITEDTLLVRKGYLTYQEDQEVMVLTKQAVYLDSDTIKNKYWIKIIDSSIISETVNLIVSSNLIREFLDM
ncbi:hypothetical protein [Listeria ivanovii]|uniref:hypothetical protein n=1 Tax=Listeria ivanovii TaxID=1638 RepID=UPI0019413EC3|nr:hypothetical protein [Listeria ivanovii]MBM5707746.1 hypothetical protein [Listeria ivanovii]